MYNSLKKKNPSGRTVQLDPALLKPSLSFKWITLLLGAILIIPPCFVSAQHSKPLKGSGRILEKTYAFRSFDKIQVKDLVGKVYVQVGQAFSVELKADDNLIDLISVTENGGQLSVLFRDNDRNRMYIEDTHVRVYITMPEISVLQYKGNSDIELKGLTGRYFRLETEGNGDSQISGSIDEFDIEKNGNGDVNAEKVKAKTVKIESYGNGNTLVHATQTVSVKGSGNGDVVIYGPAMLAAGSALKGNGDIQRKN